MILNTLVFLLNSLFRLAFRNFAVGLVKKLA